MTPSGEPVSPRDERQKMRDLEREELRRANENLKAASSFSPRELDPRLARRRRHRSTARGRNVAYSAAPKGAAAYGWAVDFPILWWGIGGVIIAGAVVRLANRRPVVARRSVGLRRGETTLALISLVALAFHCGGMFLSAIRSLPGLSMPADVIRDLGQISQIAYWLPAAALLMSLRRVWPPLLALEATALLAVGMTMFLPFGLSIHLGTIAVSVVVTVVLVVGFVASGSYNRPDVG